MPDRWREFITLRKYLFDLLHGGSQIWFHIGRSAFATMA
jgi:hypothetical protein